jgi:hypothetical protein
MVVFSAGLPSSWAAGLAAGMIPSWPFRFLNVPSSLLGCCVYINIRFSFLYTSDDDQEEEGGGGETTRTTDKMADSRTQHQTLINRPVSGFFFRAIETLELEVS